MPNKCNICNNSSALFKEPWKNGESRHFCSQKCMNMEWLIKNPKTFTAIIIKVVDGDTLKVKRIIDNKLLTIRLLGFDAPEIKQAYGIESTKLLSNKTPLGSTVYIINGGKDIYNRILGDVYTKDGSSIADYMISNGAAWHFKRYNNDQFLDNLEQEARSSKKGLWENPSPISPSDFRKQNKL